MAVKLYDGCWGVTMDKEVHGPYSQFRTEYFQDSDGICYTVEGWVIVWGNAAGDRIKPYHMWVPQKVFPTKAEARAYAERKPWWQSVKAFIVRTWYPSWAKHPFVHTLIDFVAVLGIIYVAFALFACDSPTAPVEQTCTNTVSAHGRDTVVIIPCKTARVGQTSLRAE